jgi:multicomponent K+:H+ antiporter subunit A
VRATEGTLDGLAAAPLLALLTGVLLQLTLGRILSPHAKGWLAFFSGLTALAGALALLPSIAAGRVVAGTLAPWDISMPFRYHVDGLSLVFVLMATGIGTAILLYCIHYMAAEREGTTRFYALMLIFMAGLVSLVSSADLLLAYLSWEVIGLCSYFLVGFWYKDPAASDGARKVLVMTHLPGYALLAAILVLFDRTGTFLWTDPAVKQAFTGGLFLLMLLAAMAKSVMFPLHTWIPEAMNAPTPVSALLHSACYVKAGVYLVARMYSLTAWPSAWNTTVIALGCCTMLVGALFAMLQVDLKRLLAFSTISQLGYILTGLGVGTDLGIAAGIFYCVSHGLFKGTLFLCAGVVQHATGTRDLRRLGGLAARLPNTSRVWLAAAAAIVGVPLTNGFVAKWLLYAAALDAGHVFAVLIAWLVSVFSGFYILKATVCVFYGETPAWLKDRHVEEAAPTMQIGMGVLGALCIALGFAPQLLADWLVTPAVRSLGFPRSVPVSWLGLPAEPAGPYGAVAATVVVAAACVGLAMYLLAGRSRGEPVGIFTGGDPLPASESAVTAADFVGTVEDMLAPACRLTDPDPVYLEVWRWLRDLVSRLDRVVTPLLEGHPLWATLAGAVLVSAVIWVF